MNPNSINVLIGSPEKRKQESKTQSEISKSSSQNFDFCSSKTRYSTPVTATADTTMNKSSTNPPPGAAEGGTWGSVHYIGSKTQMFACLGCLCFCIPGLCILACPQDEKDAYAAVDGKVYDAAGTYLGSKHNVKFTPSRDT